MNNTAAPVARARLAAIGCLSAAILLVELGITRLFSVITWSHFAFLAVSLALFGLSASAVFIHVTASRHPADRLHVQLWRYAIAIAVCHARSRKFNGARQR